MSDDQLSPLRGLLDSGLSEEEISRRLLDLLLQAAPPAVADAARVCAIPAWFDPAILALLTADADGPAARQEAERLVEQIAAFSFVYSRERGGYVYHEATRARLLGQWRQPENRARFVALGERLARRYVGEANEQDSRLSGPEYWTALAALDETWPNLQAAWEAVHEEGDGALVRDLAYALPNYFRQRGMWNELIAWTEAGLRACERLGDRRGAAAMQNNLGEAYRNLPTGDRAVNIERAIRCYQEALRFTTAEAGPLDYAMTQNNLGNAYRNLPTGDRAANLEQAIACYREALRFFTAEAAPLDYAGTQNNLGNAHTDLPTGDRAANLERAIACYRESLRFRTAEAAPLDYATTQNNLGVAYLKLQDYEQAIGIFERLVQFNRRDADACYNLACVYALAGRSGWHKWLGKAIRLDGKYRQLAREDADFDGIRQERRFQALVAE